MLVSDLINQSFLDLGTVAPGEGITTAEQTDAFLRLNQILAQCSIEQVTSFAVVHGSFALTAGTSTYTLGVGGALTTAAIPLMVTSWSSVSGAFRNGGVPVSFAHFEATAQNTAGESAVLVKMLAADMAYPLLSLKVFPPPAASPGALELDYSIAIAPFATVGDTVALPPAWEKFLHFQLAVDLFPQYARPGVLETLTALLSAAKGSIVERNAKILEMQQAQAPQQAA